jgi:hypothetical protein
MNLHTLIGGKCERGCRSCRQGAVPNLLKHKSNGSYGSYGRYYNLFLFSLYNSYIIKSFPRTRRTCRTCRNSMTSKGYGRQVVSQHTASLPARDRAWCSARGPPNNHKFATSQYRVNLPQE